MTTAVPDLTRPPRYTGRHRRPGITTGWGANHRPVETPAPPEPGGGAPDGTEPGQGP